MFSELHFLDVLPVRFCTTCAIARLSQTHLLGDLSLGIATYSMHLMPYIVIRPNLVQCTLFLIDTIYGLEHWLVVTAGYSKVAACSNA